MRYRIAAVLALLGFLTLGWPSPAQAYIASKPPLKVLVVGDSISQGMGGDWTWRHWLWQEFQRQHVRVDFLGPRSQVATGYGTRYERTTPWDSDHAAVSGAATDYFQPRMAQLLTDYPADVMILEIGLNDLRHGDSPATVAQQTQTLITTAWSVRPHLRVVLAQITNEGIASLDAASQKVNAAMAAWAVGKSVVIAHNRTGEGPGTLAWSRALAFDVCHPNATGQTLYAHRFAQALHVMGLLPQVPDVYRVRTWSPDMLAQVAGSVGRATVSWQEATTEVAVNDLQVLVDGRAASSWIHIPKRGDTGSVTVPLSPGTHSVQLVPKRGDMIGAPGDRVAVSVA